MENKEIEKEIQRLNEIFKDLPENKKKIAEGLIVQSARLRIRLDNLWEDIQKNGEVELFTQSDKTDPYERERPSARLFTATDKNYQAIIKQLVDLCPAETKADSKLMAMMRG